jgi:predicted phosphodiesterase
MKASVKSFCGKNNISSNEIEVSGLDIIGDVHGCFFELSKLLGTLGYNLTDFSHKENRKVVFLGDITDRGPENYKCFDLAFKMNKAGHYWIMGNHDNKIFRALKGANSLILSHGADGTMLQMKNTEYDEPMIGLELLDSIPWKMEVEFEKTILMLAHAYPSGRNMGECIYGVTKNNLRTPWWESIESDFSSLSDTKRHVLLWGHYWEEKAVLERFGENNLMGCIDTSCVRGGQLTALRFPEMYFVQVQAEEDYDMESEC